MPDRKSPRMYRIGDYSRFMGVSPDLLKHYEKLGLIRSVTPENGYHYYAFQESVPLLECMRLRSYGFSLRETGKLMKHCTFDQVQSMLDDRIDAMEKRVQFEQLVIREHREISAWMDRMRENETLICEEQMEPLLFLPQSHHLDFIQDERISEILGAWVEAMPLVKSCRQLPDLFSEAVQAEASWGLAVTESDAALLKLPVNGVVKRIPGGRYLVVHHRWPHYKKRGAPNQFSHLQSLLRERQMESARDSVQMVLMHIGMDDDRVTCGWFAIPLETEDA